MTLYTPAQVRKAIGTAIVGVYAWAGFVVNSPAAHITANEWLLLGGVGVAIAAAFGLTNEPVPIPAPEPVPEPVSSPAVEATVLPPLGAKQFIAAGEVSSPNAKFVGSADQVVPPAA